MARASQYTLGGEKVTHKRKTTLVAAGVRSFDKASKSMQFEGAHDIGYVIPGYEHRPDLISDVFYDTPEYWWLILMYNNIDDPFEGLNIGDQIKIPRI